MVKHKQANGTGTIFQRKGSGRYFGAITIYGENGKRRRITVSGKTKAETHDKLTKLKAAKLDGTLTPPEKTSVKQYLEFWLEHGARPSVRRSTFCDYEAVVRNHVVPAIGNKRLGELKAMDVQGMLTVMERKGASAQIRGKALAVLSIALNRAMAWERLMRNPCRGVAKPKCQKAKVRTLTVEEVKALFKAAETDRLCALYVLAIGTGLRQGELFGLHWSDLNIFNGHLIVTHALHELKGAIWRGETKTARGARMVKLPNFALAALRTHLQRMQAEGHASELVFCDTTGKPLRKSNVRRRSFEPLLQRAELPHIRFHDLRHTHATLLFKQNVHPKVVQDRLGHARIGQTLDTYTHFISSAQKQAVDALDELLGTSVA